MLYSFISLSRLTIGITSRRALLRAIYSASVVESTMVVWSLDVQKIGQQPAKDTIKPEQEHAVSGSSMEAAMSQFLLKSAISAEVRVDVAMVCK